MDYLRDKIENLERGEIINALKRCNWIKAKAARVLGITERMVGYKIKKYGIGMGMVGDREDRSGNMQGGDE